MEWSAQITLPPAPTSPRAARALLRMATEQWDVGEVDSVDLLLTEVVTNAVVHAHTAFTVAFTAREGWTRVEVRDCSPDPLRRRRPTSRSEHGRGLLLLDRLAADWGWEEDSTSLSGDAPSSTCKTVWFEVTAIDTGSDREAALHAAFDMDSIAPL